MTRKDVQVGMVKWAYSERGVRKEGVSSVVLVHGFSGLSDAWNWVIKVFVGYLRPLMGGGGGPQCRLSILRNDYVPCRYF